MMAWPNTTRFTVLGIPALRKQKPSPLLLFTFPQQTLAPTFNPSLKNLVIFLKAKISIAMTLTFIRHPLPNLLLPHNPRYTVAEL
jgi:hypothetical protein